MTTKTPLSYAVPTDATREVVRLDDSGITTRTWVSGELAFFCGHYPNFPIFPGVFVIESVHQAALMYSAARIGNVWLREIRSVRFRHPVLPDDWLACDCAVARDGDTVTVRAACATDRVRVADVVLHYAVECEDTS
jgi:3-hydroxyacyl-[acyl-carrier-protein] dehydratase